MCALCILLNLSLCLITGYSGRLHSSMNFGRRNYVKQRQLLFSRRLPLKFVAVEGGFKNTKCYFFQITKLTVKIHLFRFFSQVTIYFR